MHTPPTATSKTAIDPSFVMVHLISDEEYGTETEADGQAMQRVEEPSANTLGKAADAFFASDDDLSGLDGFVSIQELLSRGGEDRHRAEFILNQFTGSNMPTSPKIYPTEHSTNRTGGQKNLATKRFRAFARQ